MASVAPQTRIIVDLLPAVTYTTSSDSRSTGTVSNRLKRKRGRSSGAKPTRRKQRISPTKLLARGNDLRDGVSPPRHVLAAVLELAGKLCQVVHPPELDALGLGEDGNVGGVAAGPGDGEMLIDFPQKPGLIARCGHVKEPPGVLPGHPTLWAEAERQGSTWPAVGLSGPAAIKRRNWFSPSRGKVLLALPHGLAHLVARHAGCGFARCLEHRSLVRD